MDRRDLPQGQRFDRADCPVEQTLALISGKWRPLVLFRLGQGPMRFNALARSLAPVSARVLAATLRDLEGDGLVWRQSLGSVPPEVSYGLTPRGTALEPIFDAMARWYLAGRPGPEKPEAAPGIPDAAPVSPKGEDQFLA